MAEIFKKTILTVVALSFLVWMVIFGLSQKSAEKVLGPAGGTDHLWGKVVIPLSQTLHKKGLYRLSLGQYQQAETLFNQAVKHDLFHMESWLRLVETQAAMGNLEIAGKILSFSLNQTERVVRWKWQQALLAQELGFEEQFVDAINMLLQYPDKRKNSYQLITDHFQGRMPRIIAALSPGNKPAYLKWLMKWDRLEDTKLVWDDMVIEGIHEKEILVQYVHYLLTQKQITEAIAIWRPFKNEQGVNNGGFEYPSIQKAFGWKYRNPDQGRWRIHRTIATAHTGAFSLQVDFPGDKNLNFKQISQIIPIEGGHKYALAYARKSRNLTTDQGPFIEVLGYDDCDLAHRSKQMYDTNPWQEAQIVFDAPAACQAIHIRVRRRPSKRINNLIAGTLWLDDFRLEKNIQQE